MHALTTLQLALEPLTIDHAPEMFEVLSDPEIYYYLDNPPPPSVEHLRNVYKNSKQESRLMVAKAGSTGWYACASSSS